MRTQTRRTRRVKANSRLNLRAVMRLNINNMDNVRLHIARAMDRAKLSQKQLSKQTGVTRQSIGSYLSGTTKIGYDSFLVICNRLNLL